MLPPSAAVSSTCFEAFGYKDEPIFEESFESFSLTVSEGPKSIYELHKDRTKPESFANL